MISLSIAQTGRESFACPIVISIAGSVLKLRQTARNMDTGHLLFVTFLLEFKLIYIYIHIQYIYIYIYIYIYPESKYVSICHCMRKCFVYDVMSGISLNILVYKMYIIRMSLYKKQYIVYHKYFVCQMFYCRR